MTIHTDQNGKTMTTITFEVLDLKKKALYLCQLQKAHLIVAPLNPFQKSNQEEEE